MGQRKNNPSTLGALGERGFIKRILPRLPHSRVSFLVKPGDDAAVLKTSSRPVLTIDGLTEGTHFKSRWSKLCQSWGGFSLGRGLGWKLMGSSLSDLAAMGSTTHRWAMIYLGAPGSTGLDFLGEFQKGVSESAAFYHCTVVGGDTVHAKDLSLVSAVGAELAGPRALTRSGARVGDLICIAGTVGDASIGLKVLEKKITLQSSLDRAFFVRRFFRHEPLFDSGKILSSESGVSSLIDLSDALRDTVEIISQSSDVGARVDLDRIPVSDAYRKNFVLDGRLLTGGEDYSLMFTLRPSSLSALRRKMSFAVVGHVQPRSAGCSYFLKGERIKPPASFQHFK